MMDVLVPTRAEIQLELTKAENGAARNLRGVAAWVASGLKLEEQRYGFTVYANLKLKLGEDWLWLQRRDRLRSMLQ